MPLVLLLLWWRIYVRDKLLRVLRLCATRGLESNLDVDGEGSGDKTVFLNILVKRCVNEMKHAAFVGLLFEERRRSDFCAFSPLRQVIRTTTVTEPRYRFSAGHSFLRSCDRVFRAVSVMNYTSAGWTNYGGQKIHHNHVRLASNFWAKIPEVSPWNYQWTFRSGLLALAR